MSLVLRPHGVWLFRAEFHHGEAISSLLARQARLNEMEFNELLRALGNPSKKGHVDLDIKPAPALLESISYRMGIPTERLVIDSLEQKVSNILPLRHSHSVMNHSWRPSHAPWLLPAEWLGLREIVGPPSRGIPYCIKCAGESSDFIFKATHRFSFMVCCPKHRVLLRDDCPRCGLPISPGTALNEMPCVESDADPSCKKCNTFNRNLKDQDDRYGSSSASADLIAIQTMMLQATEGRSITVPQIGEMSARRFISGCRIMISVATYFLDHGLQAANQIEQKFRSIPRLLFRRKRPHPMEFEYFDARVERMKWLAWIAKRPLDRWPEILGADGLPISIHRSTSHPWDWIDDEGILLKGFNWLSSPYKLAHSADHSEDRRFHAVVIRLQLTPTEISSLLGNLSGKQVKYWMNRPVARLPSSSAHRAAHFLRIWDRLQCLGGSEDSAMQWLTRSISTSPFRGRTPLHSLCKDQSGAVFEKVSKLLERGTAMASDGTLVVGRSRKEKL